MAVIVVVVVLVVVVVVQLTEHLLTSPTLPGTLQAQPPSFSRHLGGGFSHCQSTGEDTVSCSNPWPDGPT
jgi:hypothetical protein